MDEKAAAGESDTGSFRRAYNVFRGRYLFKVGGLTLVVTILLLSAGYVGYTQTAATVEQQAEEELLSSAQREADGLDGFINETSNDIVAMSANPIYANGSTAEIRQQLEADLSLFPRSTQDAHVYNLGTSEIEVSTDSEQAGTTLSRNDRAWAVLSQFDAPDEVSVSDTYEYDSNKEIGFVTPISGRPTHAIVVTVDLNRRSDVLSLPTEDGTVEVVDKQSNDIVLAPELDRILTEYAFTGKVSSFRRIPPGESRVETVQVDDSESVSGDSAVVATAAMEEKDWVVTVAAPERTAYAAAQDAGENLILLIGLSVLGLLVVSVVVSRDISSAVSKLSEYAEEIEHENLNVDIDRSRTDEFGELAGLLARIRDALTAQIETANERAVEAEQAQEAAKQAQQETQRAKERAEQFSQQLQAEASRFGTKMQRAAEGDLTQRLDSQTDSEAMAEIADSFNAMLADLDGTVQQLQVFAEDVAAASEEANADSQKVKQASEEVSELTQTIASSANRQREKLDTVSEEMSTLSRTTEEAAATTETVAEMSTETATVAADGETVAREAINEMETVQERMDATVQNVEQLEQRIAQIDDIVELIGEIAEQTNMLALNANIEAARAGSDETSGGDGFAVVAAEIKQLAGETQASAEEVAAHIEEIQEQTAVTVTDIQTAEQTVERTTDSVVAAVDAFISVAEYSAETDEGVQEIAQATDDQAESAAEVVSMVEDVAEISESTAAHTADVSAAAEQQAASMTRVTANVRSLTEQAERLQAEIDRFEVSGTAAELTVETDGGGR